MGKHDFLTPKAIGNRIKARGLGKLRWYCQMCQKQCRDENGFKCHLTSESHRRQMSVVAANTGKVIDSFSETFEQGYLDLLSRRWGEKRVNANYVYNEYIKDRHHVHMNATQWTTLTSFVKYLGQEGKAIVEETEKGWYVQYIDRDPETLARKQRLAEMRDSDLTDEERTRRFMLKQAKELQARAAAEGRDGAPAPTELLRDADSGERVKITLRTGAADEAAGGGGGGGAGAGEAAGAARVPSAKLARVFAMGGDDEEEEEGAVGGRGARAGADGEAGEDEDEEDGSGAAGRKRARVAGGSSSSFSSAHAASRAAHLDSGLQELLVAEEAKRRRATAAAAAAAATAAASSGSAASSRPGAGAGSGSGDAGRGSGGGGRTAHWLAPGVVVKIMNRELEGGQFYKEKGVVKRVHDRFVADVQLLESSIKLRLDQDDLETVIPKEGGEVLFVNGVHRGQEGVLRALHVDQFCADVELRTGPERGSLVRGVEYEDISRLA